MESSVGIGRFVTNSRHRFTPLTYTKFVCMQDNGRLKVSRYLFVSVAARCSIDRYILPTYFNKISPCFCLFINMTLPCATNAPQHPPNCLSFLSIPPLSKYTKLTINFFHLHMICTKILGSLELHTQHKLQKS